MNIYYIRAIPSDWPTLLALGEKLGAIQLHYETETDAEGNTVNVGEPTVSATQGGAWDYIGEIHKPTGEVDAEGNPILALTVDAEGTPYWHANLITPLALGTVAAEMAAADPDIAAGLANLGHFFLLDVNGDAATPASPHRVFAGV